STERGDGEMPSASAGVLKEIKVSEGQTVPINTVVAVIDAAGSAAAAPAPAPAPVKSAPAAAAAPAPAPAPKPQIVPPPAPQPTVAAPAASATKEGTRVHSSPLVRRMAKEHGIDLTTVPGTGAGGRVSKQDIEAVISGSAAPAHAAPAVVPATSVPAPART